MKAVLIALAAVSLVAARSGDGYPPIVKTKTLYAKNDLRGEKAPKIEAETWLSGAAPNLKGKVVFVDFWATWCGPCRELIPEVNDWAKKYGKDIVFIGLSDEPAATVQKFMKETPMEYNVAVDTKKRTSGALGVQGIPHVMIVSPDGVVRWQGFPGSEEDKLTDKVLEQIIAASKASKN